MGATCTCTESIQVLEIQEFHLPTFALKVLHALKVWAKIRIAGKSTNGLEWSRTHAQIQYLTNKPLTLTTQPRDLT